MESIYKIDLLASERLPGTTKVMRYVSQGNPDR